MCFGMERLNAEPNSKIWQFTPAMLINYTIYLINNKFVLVFMKHINNYVIRHASKTPQSTFFEEQSHFLNWLLILATFQYQAFWRRIIEVITGKLSL